MDYIIELPLSKTINVDGVSIGEIKFKNITKADLFQITSLDDETKMVAKFSQLAGYANDKPLTESVVNELPSQDGYQIEEIMAELLFVDSGDVSVTGDGFDKPMVYKLSNPIKYQDKEITAFQFQSRKYGDMASVRDQENEEKMFDEFFRKCGKVVDHEIAITDGMLKNLSGQDTYVVVEHILGKLLKPKKTWKKL